MRKLTPADPVKWNKIFAEYDEKTAHTTSGLTSFAHHFVENEILIEKDAENKVQRNKPEWTPSNDEETSEFMYELNLARHLHDETLIPTHRYSCIVMLYIVVERELRRLVDNLHVVKHQKLKVKDLKGSYLEQTKKFLDVCYHLDISKCPSYSAIDDLRRVRNCIVHNHGEVSLCAKPEQKYLCGLKVKYKGLLCHPRSEIDLSQESIKQFLQETMTFFVWVFEQLQQLQPVAKLNWKINAAVELKRLDKILSKIES
jgi:hypothetical protein